MVLSMYMKYEAMSQNHVNDTNGQITYTWLIMHGIPIYVNTGYNNPKQDIEL